VIVDKSQVIEVGLIRRKIVKKDCLIRRKFSIDAELWRGSPAFCASTNSKP